MSALPASETHRLAAFLQDDESPPGEADTELLVCKHSSRKGFTVRILQIRLLALDPDENNV